MIQESLIDKVVDWWVDQIKSYEKVCTVFYKSPEMNGIFTLQSEVAKLNEPTEEEVEKFRTVLRKELMGYLNTDEIVLDTRTCGIPAPIRNALDASGIHPSRIPYGVVMEITERNANITISRW